MLDESDFSRRIHTAFAAARRPTDSDIVDELAQHAAAAFQAARAEGADLEEAERQVDTLIVAWTTESGGLVRRPRRDPLVEPPPTDRSALTGLGQDITYAFRLLTRQPGFALLAIVTMALGTGATTVLFSVIYGVLLKPLPWPESDRLVRVTESRQGHEPRIRGTITNATYIAWHQDPKTIEEIGGWRNTLVTAVVGRGDATRLQTTAVTSSLFRVLEARPLLGRGFIEDDAKPGGDFRSKEIAILSYGLWKEWFGGRTGAIGSAIILDGKPHTIIGVMPGDFAFPDRATRAWTAWAIPSVLTDKGERRVTLFSAIARLRPGTTPGQAAAEGTTRARSAPDPGLAAVAMFGGNGPAEISATSAVDMMTAEVRPALRVMFAAVLLLLVTATANIASWQLARATSRRREIAIRSAIGAGRARLTRQLAIESILIGVTGGFAGLVLAIALIRALPSLLPADFPRVDDIEIDTRVMLFTVAASLVAGVAFSLLPVLHARRLNVTEALSEGPAASAGGFVRTPLMRARTTIMVAQIAVACVLLIGAALLTRTFVALLNSDRGYDPRNLLTARLPLSPDDTPERRTNLLNTLTARMRASPGVVEVAFGNGLPLLSAGGFRALRMRPPINPSIEIEANAIHRMVSPGYFRALGVRLIAGRVFNDEDTTASRQVIVVNRSFAAKYLGDQPVGAVLPDLGVCREPNNRSEVIGVVEDMHQDSVTDAPQTEVFTPYSQVGCPTMMSSTIIVIRSEDDPARYAPILRSALREIAPTLALESVMTMEERVMNTLAKPRLYAIVLAGFGASALLIAAVGLFGVLSYSIAQRSREIGIRTALGARPGDIVFLVFRQVAIIGACGITAGAWLAFATSHWLDSVLYGVNPHDPLSFVVVPIVLVLVTVIASLIPARRAAELDPLQVLRAG